MGCCSKHVILVPTPAVGHCVPFFYFAARLVHLGTKVTMLVSNGLMEKFQTDALFAMHAGEVLREGADQTVSFFCVAINIANLLAIRKQWACYVARRKQLVNHQKK